ncbi:TPA: peptidoglycan DD-metalloendopeptidase family protein [Enterococcus faecalis]
MADTWLSPLAVSYQATQEWDEPDYLSGGQAGIHGGIDLAPKAGTNPPVYSAKPGTVEEVVPNHPVGGNYIVIKHMDNYWTYYGHLATLNVSVGQQVTNQTVLGLCGATGGATGIHLHFEVWRGGKWQRINPREVINLDGSGRDSSNNGGNGGIYTGGALLNAGKSISESNIRLIISAGKKYNIKPSFMIAQMFIESHWGDPSISIVGSKDNNWAGISEPFSVPADLGINMSRGSARPVGEGGYYIHFATMNDFFKAYAFVLSKRNGLYNVEGANSIEEYCKGLFRIGGANSDYAATGYQNYFNMLIPTYNSINKQNPGKLAQIDASTEEITNNGGLTTMQCLYERPINPNTGALDINGSATTMMFCNGVNTRRVYHNDEVNIVKELYRKNNGKEIPVYYKKDWPKTSPWYIRLEAMFPVVK